MKLRLDFVTNSSSSSFIIAVYKAFCIGDMPQLIARSNRAKGLFTIEELVKQYGYRYGEDFDAENDARYIKLKEAINNGFTVFFLDVDYGDTEGANFFEKLPRINDGRGYYLIYNSD
jgi:hypothetical protein